MRPDSSAYLSSRDTSRRTGEAAAMNIAPQNRVLGTRDRPVGHATHATGIVSPARSGSTGAHFTPPAPFRQFRRVELFHPGIDFCRIAVTTAMGYSSPMSDRDGAQRQR